MYYPIGPRVKKKERNSLTTWNIYQFEDSRKFIDVFGTVWPSFRLIHFTIEFLVRANVWLWVENCQRKCCVQKCQSNRTQKWIDDDVIRTSKSESERYTDKDRQKARATRSSAHSQHQVIQNKVGNRKQQHTTNRTSQNVYFFPPRKTRERETHYRFYYILTVNRFGGVAFFFFSLSVYVAIFTGNAIKTESNA